MLKVLAKVENFKRQRIRTVDSELERAKQRLSRQAVLLNSGVGLHRAAPLLDAEGLSIPVSPGEAFKEIWASIAAMTQVAYFAGAPFAWGCESLAAAFEELLLLRKRRRVLLAGPKSSMILIACLPLVALFLGALSGFDPFAVFATEFGLILLCGGVLLLVLGVFWLNQLIKQAANQEHLTGFECELMVLALRGGIPVARAKKLVADAICETDSGWLQTNELAPTGTVGRAIALVAASGSGLTQVLLESAARQRRYALENLETGAEKLGSRALLPMACCILPSFVALGVLPVVIAMLGGIGLPT